MTDEIKARREARPAVPMLTGEAPGDQGGIDFTRLLAILIENRWRILSTSVLGLLAGHAALYMAVPVYRADALVQLEGGMHPMAGMEKTTSLYDERTAGMPLPAEIEILKSRMVLGKAVDRMHLDIQASPKYWNELGAAIARHYRGGAGSLAEPWFHKGEYAWGGEKIKVESLEVPKRLLDAGLTLVAETGDRYTLLDPSGQLILPGTVGRRSRHDWDDGESLELFVSQLHARPGTHFLVQRVSRVSAIGSVQGGLQVKERTPGSRVMQLNFSHSNPDAAIEILNEIVNAYLRQNVERRSEEAERRLHFVQQHLPAMKEELEAAENAFNRYRKKTGSVDLQLETQTLLQLIVGMEADLRTLELKREELMQRYMPSHPFVASIDLQISETRDALAKANKKASELPDAQQEVLHYTRDVDVKTELYTSLLNSEQELRMAKVGTVATVRILDHAVSAGLVSPAEKSVRLKWLGIGLALGVLWAFARHLLRTGIEDPDQVEEALGIPVYATVPHSKEQAELAKRIARSPRNSAAERQPPALLALTAKESLAVESLRSLRTTLHFALLEARSNSVLLTGPVPRVGKSFVSANFAAVLAQSGKRILLIDSDLRQGHLHRIFGESRSPGVSEYVSEGREIDAVVRPTPLEGLFFIPTGVLPPNPSELLMHDRYAQLLSQAEQRYDYVLIDSPPVLAATDAVIIGQHAGASLMVIRAGMHPLREIKDAVKRQLQGGVHLRGVIFNDMPVGSGRYGYGYRKYAYPYTYGAKRR